MKDDLKIIMSNFHIQLVAEGEGVLRRALEIAFAAHHGKADGWGVKDVDPKAKVEEWTDAIPKLMGISNARHKVLVFYWSKPESEFDYNKFPTPIDAAGAAKIAMDWLAQNGEYGDEPDHDGSNHQGFYLFCNVWGHVLGSHYGMVAVGPAWCECGK